MDTDLFLSARSYLFVPADRLDRLDKALATEADVVIVDLEDAVAPEAKVRARAALVDAEFPRDRVMVRINGSCTEWNASDVEMVTRTGVRAVMLPKAESADEIGRVCAGLGPLVSITALVESARGVWNALEVAQAASVVRLAFGSIDFAENARTSSDNQALSYARSRLVLASRMADLPQPIDGVTTATGDPAVLEQDTRHGQRMGFGAKLCIHPNQVEGVNRIFLPSDTELQWASKVLAAAAHSNGAAILLDGLMVDLPVIKLAERILNSARR